VPLEELFVPVTFTRAELYAAARAVAGIARRR